jgi:thiamine pyrophosphate-dependent acetolactate synthase large subunit-like protein
MAELVADYVLKRLREWGVHRIYGYPGDGINGFLGALDRAAPAGKNGHGKAAAAVLGAGAVAAAAALAYRAK